MTIAHEPVIEKPAEAEELIHRFTRREFHQMADVGLFENKRVELLEGRILDMPPQNEPHVDAVSKLVRFLNRNLSDEFQVRCQAPIAATKDSEPEPDFAVVPDPQSAPADNPETAILAIEVSDSTLSRDRQKAKIYATAGIREYWIVNIQSRTIEQYTQPQAGKDAHYATRQIFKEDESVHCTVLPLPPLPVKDCLRWV